MARREASPRRAADVRPRASGRVDPVTFEEARAAFPVLERFAYLNAGAFGPLARATVEATQARLRDDARYGRASRQSFDEALVLRDQARSRLADVLHVPTGNLALTTSTTRSCNTVLAGLELGPH